MFSRDYLKPILRGGPGNNGVMAVGLDPREAKFVLDRGYALIDGERWKAQGFPGIQGDGRIFVRFLRG